MRYLLSITVYSAWLSLKALLLRPRIKSPSVAMIPPQDLCLWGCRRKRSQKPQQTQPWGLYFCHLSSGKRRYALHLGGTPGRRRMPRGEYSEGENRLEGFVDVGWVGCLKEERRDGVPNSDFPFLMPSSCFCNFSFSFFLKILWSLIFHLPHVLEKSSHPKDLPRRVICDWRQPQAAGWCRVGWRGRRRRGSNVRL